MESLLSQLSLSFLEASADAFFVLSPDGQIIEVNDIACQWLERTRDDLLTIHLYDIAAVYSKAQWQAHWKELKHARRLILTGVHWRVNGWTFPVACTLLYTVVNACEYACCVARNISAFTQRQETLLRKQKTLRAQLKRRVTELERVKTELNAERAERQRSTALVDAIIDATTSSMGDAFFGAFAQVLSRLFCCRYVFVCEHVDRPVTRVRTLAFCDRGKLLDNIEYAVASAPCEETAAGEMVFYPDHIQQLFPDDHDLVSMDAESYCGIPLFDQANQLLGHLAIMDDRPMQFNVCDHPALGVFINRVATELAHRQAESERQRAEEERFRLEVQLRQARKMEALGSLSGGVAHEFNNILASVFGYVEMACLELPPDSSQVMYLNHVLIAATRAKELVQKILTFSRHKTVIREPVSMPLVVNETLGLLRATLPATIDLQVHIPEDIGSVMADRAQLQEMVMNLCTNAEYAMRQSGGQLCVSLTTTEVDEEFAAAHLPLEPGPCVCLTVQDTGPGITPDIIERIYDPFFTTKSVGEGTGMGLAIVHSIVTDHGGAITVVSQPGEGSTFQAYFPQVRTPEAITPPSEPSMPYGTGRILVVDDEPTQTELLALQLQHLGYDVQRAAGAHEAWCLFREMPHHFDLVITDQTMPEMTGEHLVQALHQIRSDVPIILVTGFSHLIDTDKAEALGVNAFLMKPISMEVLAHTVHRVLNQTTQDSYT